jgi:hypothetical protein
MHGAQSVRTPVWEKIKYGHWRFQRLAQVQSSLLASEGILDMTADELRAISLKLSTYLELHPDDKDTRSMADQCAEIAAFLEASSAYQRLRPRDPDHGGLEDRLLRIASGAPLTRREIRLAGIFALVWFAMDGFWFICTLNHWFGL